MSWLLHWLAVHTGTVNEPGPYYGFWSGFGGDLAIIGALLWGPVVLLRKHNCHVARCWRIGMAPVDGTPWHVCWRHHPAGRPTHAHILSLHRQHTARLAAQAYRQAGTPAPPAPGAPGERLYDHQRDGI